MLKKTTVYLSDEDIVLLRKKAATQHVTVAEALRMSIKEACKPKTRDEKSIWNSLDRIWAKTSHLSTDKIESSIDKAVSEVRSAKKTCRRS